MCSISFEPIYIDDLLRLLLSLFLFGCCIILSMIFIKEKAWDEAFWICFSGFVASLGAYGHVINQIYLENTFSYDGFVAGASFITVSGLLFAKRKYEKFSDKFLGKNTPILIATFVVFAFIYISTINYDGSCISTYRELIVEILQIVLYPLVLLFAITAFMFRFTICLSVFILYMVLFLIEDIILISHVFIVVEDYDVLVEEIVCSTISMLIAMMTIYILMKTKKIYKEKKNGSN